MQTKMLFEFFLYILSYDLWFYVSHWLLHTSLGYAYIHKHHHAVKADTMNYTETYVSHFIEGPLQSLGILVPLYYETPTFEMALAVFLFLNVRGMLRHDVRMTWLVGNHHVLHHAYPKYNFGDLWLDLVMGTNYPNFNEYTFGLIYN